MYACNACRAEEAQGLECSGAQMQCAAALILDRIRSDAQSCGELQGAQLSYHTCTNSGFVSLM